VLGRVLMIDDATFAILSAREKAASTSAVAISTWATRSSLHTRSTLESRERFHEGSVRSAFQTRHGNAAAVVRDNRARAPTVAVTKAS